MPAPTWLLDREAGDAAAARDQFATLLLTLERVLSAEHSDTLTDRASLAHWTCLAGQMGPTAGRS